MYVFLSRRRLHVVTSSDDGPRSEENNLKTHAYDFVEIWKMNAGGRKVRVLVA